MSELFASKNYGMGNTYVVWPTDIEKLRVIHEMVRG